MTMQDESALLEAVRIMRDLRQRCEWDAEQSHTSLRPYLIEEAYELDEAIASGDRSLLREELGDLLLQVLFHSVIAEETGEFGIGDVALGLVEKMKRRHPHLYGGGEQEPWEKMKAKRRSSIEAGLPGALPSLHRAHRLQDRAGGVGFDWPDVSGPAAKVREELAEFEKTFTESPVTMTPGGAPRLDENHARAELELGDLLFACVNLCRKAGVHAALALDRANAKFAHRFAAVQHLAAARGINLSDASPAELDDLWEEVKRDEDRL